MHPRSLTPCPTSIPFDDLIPGHSYRWTLRVWGVHPQLHYVYQVDAVFVGLSSLGRGEQLRCDVYFADGTGTTFYRAQIFNVEAV